MTDLKIADRRQDFPLLGDLAANGKPLVYLDTGASAQKPAVVIEAVKDFYEHSNANVHRGIYALSEKATALYEGARSAAATWINAPADNNIVFVRGTTEAMNLVAYSFAKPRLKAGDEIIVSQMEHHANIVPWQQVCEATGAVLKVVPLKDKGGDLDLEAYQSMLSKRTKLVSIVHVSNVLGTINPVKKIIAMAHDQGIPVCIDGAQAVPHMAVDVQDLDCDFYAFSSHKMYGPTGIGVLYAKQEYLEAMPPYQTGGGMICQVSFEGTSFAPVPQRFEAGTPAIAQAAGLTAAIEYLQGVGFEAIAQQDQALLSYAEKQLKAIPGLMILGDPEHRASVLSWVLEDAHAHDVATILDQEGICVRAGHHCTMPLMAYYQVPSAVRSSFAFYNTLEEVDRLVEGIHKVKEIFS